jgi:hypothetical protein
MRQKPLKQPRARNNAAHASLQSYFDRISHSLEDRVSEYVQMHKYVRVYEESQKLLDIEKTINIAAGSIFETSFEKKLDVSAMNQLVQGLNKKNKALKAFLQGKPLTSQIKLLDQIAKSVHTIIVNLMQIHRDIARINDVVPVLKALLKLKDKDGHHEHDPLLIEITNALANNINEPSLVEIKMLLTTDRANLSEFDAKLHFESFNDVSDKLVGLLNDKLLLIIGISEFLIAGVEDDGANDVGANERLPDELRVLFLAASLLDVLSKIKEVRNSLKTILTHIKFCMQVMDSDKLESKFKALLKNGGPDNLYEGLVNITPRVLQRVKKSIIEISPGLDAFELRLKLETLDLNTVMNMTYGLIYEKSNRTWENPYYM